jgi:hypothetical protein
VTADFTKKVEELAGKEGRGDADPLDSMPQAKESLVLGVLGFLALLFLRREWLSGFVYGFLLGLFVRLGYVYLSRLGHKAALLGLLAFFKQVLLGGLAILGIPFRPSANRVALGAFPLAHKPLDLGFPPCSRESVRI